MAHSTVVLRNTVSDMPYSRLENDKENSDSEESTLHDDIQSGTHKPESTKLIYQQTIQGSLEDETYTAFGYKQSSSFAFLYHFFGMLSCGILYLVAYWKPDWKVSWTKKQSTLDSADTLILKDIDGVIYVVDVYTQEIEDVLDNVNFENTEDSEFKISEIRFFTFQYLKYIWNADKGQFLCLVGLGKDTFISSLLQDFRGYSFEEQAVRENLHGKNCITVEVKSYARLLFTEVLNPFYIFQIASLILWASDEYYLYAVCIFLISCLSIGLSLFETRKLKPTILKVMKPNPKPKPKPRPKILGFMKPKPDSATCPLSAMDSYRLSLKQSENLKNMVEASNASYVLVLRAPGELKPVEVDASSIIPGDVLVIPPSGCVMACDAVLISGNAIVNESMLTGESVPVTKTPLTSSEEDEMYSPEKHNRHTLFCGTDVIQTRYYGKEQVLALVVRTGFSTAKGELVRSILYPRPIDFKFYNDSMKFIGFMFFVSMIGMSYSLYLHISRTKPLMTTIVRTLDIVTIVVPPALPAAMTVGTYYAQNRLRKLGIFCISPPRINVCGKLKLVCFDKTGTLTEDGLEVWGAIGVENEVDGSNKGLWLGSPCHQIGQLDARCSLMAALATCHSLTYINGQLTGDPLDMQMFKATKWDLVEPEKDGEIFDSLIPTLVRPSFKPLISSHSALVPPLREAHDSAPKLAAGDLLTNSESFKDGGEGGGGGGVVVKGPSVLPHHRGGAGCASHGRFRSIEIRMEPPLISLEGPSCLKFDHSRDGAKNKGSCEEATTSPSSDQPSLTIEQVMAEATAHPDNLDQIATVAKPFVPHESVLADFPSPLIDVAETSFQVPYEIGIVRQFPFSSSIQRMSVIVRVLGKSYMELYCKGAPEVIQSLCRPETIPVNLASVLNKFTVQGFRVIALAHRNLERKLSWHNAQRIARKQLECDMTFLGLLILQNVLKPETSPVIEQLKRADIRTVMVTGDNILTAICVARDCGMVDENDRVLLAKIVEDNEGTGADKVALIFEPTHSGDFVNSTEAGTQQEHPTKRSTSIPVEKEGYHLAVTGTVWAQIRDHFSHLIPYVVSGGTIFARMSPDQKVQLVEEFQELGYVVGMCGDGANDCGALKAAHVGISLSEAEASVAAPFTSNVPNITCVPKVICEGRGALTTNFSVFKYMALYSIIQFVSVLILYSACTNLSDPQFLYIDLFIVTSVAVFMGYSKARHTLVPKRPLSNLIGSVNLFSVLVQIVLVVATQAFAYFYLLMQPWYTSPTNKCSDIDSDDKVNTWETNVLFCVSCFQYLSLGIIFSPGHPFRKPLYTNVWLLSTIAFFALTSLWLLIYPPSFLQVFMKLKSFPGEPKFLFRVTLLNVILIHLVLGWSIEYFIAGSSWLKRIFRCCSCKKQHKNLFKRIQKQIAEDNKWPPMISTPPTASS